MLAMMMGPMSLLAVIHSWKMIRPRLKVVIICIVSYMVMSFVGGLAAYAFSPPQLQKLFGYVLVFVGLTYALQFFERRIGERALLELSVTNVLILGMIAGTVGGLFGIGGGILLVPVFTTLFGLGQNESRAISLAVLLPPVSIGAVIKYGVIESDINWPYAGLLLVSYMATNGLGAKVGHGHHPKTLKRILGVLLIASGMILISI
jgi:uncharacterized membrane protein YfcA